MKMKSHEVMRPYRRKHRNWKTQGKRGMVNSVYYYLRPFICNLRILWKLGPPFPLSGKITITLLTWLLLLLPLLYFLVPPLATVLLINYFSETWTCDEVFKKLGETCAEAMDGFKFHRKTMYLCKLFDRFSVAFFVYDYYQILKYLRDF